MICTGCRNGRHDTCKGCPCHHERTQRLEDGTLAPVKGGPYGTVVIGSGDGEPVPVELPAVDTLKDVQWVSPAVLHDGRMAP